MQRTPFPTIVGDTAPEQNIENNAVNLVLMGLLATEGGSHSTYNILYHQCFIIGLVDSQQENSSFSSTHCKSKTYF